MTESKKQRPIHPRVRARYASEDVGIIASFAKESERARIIAEREAKFQAEWGEDKMPALIAQYERDLAAWRAENPEED